MDCREFESLILTYAAGELSEKEAAICCRHLESCRDCCELLEGYSSIIAAIENPQMMMPTRRESVSLSKALAKVDIRPTPARKVIDPLPKGLLGFALASVGVFALIAIVLALQTFGRINILSIAQFFGPVTILATMTVVVFVTSFVPIAVTAKRRPLNGMTFRR